MMFSKSDISLVLFMLSYHSSNMADRGTMFRDVYGDFKDPVLTLGTHVNSYIVQTEATQRV